MGLTVNTNLTAMNAIGNLAKTNRALQSTFQKVSSGVRINSASDDAAGLAVAENLEVDTRSARQARRNVADGIGVVNIVEGAANEISDILKRQRELAVQSASETLANTERHYIQDEYTKLTEEVDRIARTTEFNGTALAAFNVPGGAPQGGTVGGDPANVINVQAGIHDTSNDRIGIALPSLEYFNIALAAGVGSPLDLSTSTNAQTAITDLVGLLVKVNEFRSIYGATENRLESALRSLDVYSQNMNASQSRIRDADMAFETAEMAKQQVLQQAGVAVLGQANGLSQSALRLIG